MEAADVLQDLGFAVTEGRLSSCFVLRDRDGRTVDVHPVVFDREGNGNYTMENGEVWVYAAAWFDGSGIIRGEAGYPLDDEDRQDMAALQRRFGLELLPEQTQGLPT